jgi:hypothetical protein
MMKTFITCVAALALSFAVSAQDKADAAKPKKAAGSGAAKGKGLHPEMTVAADAGTFDAPMGKLGEKSDSPWSSTSMAAGVNGKPEAGKPTTVSGEIIDMSCYLQLGKHGEKHVACGKKCLTAGQPIGLLAKDGSIYMLMEEEHDPRRDGQTAGFRKAATDHLGHIMEVTGTQASVAGHHAIYVQGYVNK